MLIFTPFATMVFVFVANEVDNLAGKTLSCKGWKFQLRDRQDGLP